MSEDFMSVLREPPTQRFAGELRSRLRRIDADRSSAMSSGSRLRAAAAVAMVAVATGLLFAFPGVRATAQQFLDLFRVTNFVAVPVEPKNLERLTSGFDLPHLMGDQIEVYPAPPRRSFGTVEEAAAAAGMRLNVPQYLPPNVAFTQAQVEPERVTRIVASTAKLRSVMQLFDISDLTIPDSLDGEVAIVTVPTSVFLTYGSGRARIDLAQATAPQVSLPAGIDLRTLGEIGLRILGLSPKQAQDVAQTIDWRSTLVVPISPNVESFQQITVQGHSAVHLAPRGAGRRVLLWSDGERVYALLGSSPLPELIAVANSLGPA